MINALRRSEVEHALRLLAPSCLAGDQRLTAIRGRTQHQAIKINQSGQCDQRLTAIRGRTRKTWKVDFLVKGVINALRRSEVEH